MADIKNNKKSNKTKEETTSDVLHSYLDRCCNILRGPINQDEFKSYITPLLFFKRISDVYDEEYNSALSLSEGDAEYAGFSENHKFVVPDGCHWKDVREKSENVGSAIISAMIGIERENPNTLNGLFSSFDDAVWTDKNKLSDERLKNLIEHMSSIKIGNQSYSADVMGDCYEYMIKKFADLSKKTAGEFYTPRAVVKLLVMLLNPKAGDTIYDPACGTGGMLIEAIRYINNDIKTYGRIYGQEKNLSTSAIARMNLYLHGASDFKIVKEDTLRNPIFLKEGKIQTFNCVIANPPFSLKKWGADRFESDAYGRNIWGCPTDANGDYAWIQHMVSSMDKKDGRLCVVLSQGALSRGKIEGEMRKKLIESDKLECVISLSDHLFYGSGIPAAILVMNNNKIQSHKGKVCFIDAGKIFTPRRAQNILSDENVDLIYSYYKSYKDTIDFVKIASIDDIQRNGYTLAVNRYVEMTPEETIPLDEAKKNFYSAMNDVIEAENKLKMLLKDGGYLND